MFSTADPFFLTFTPKRDADSISHRRPQNGAALRMAPPSKLAPPSKWRRPQNGAALKIGATLKMAPPSKWHRPQNGTTLKMAPPSKLAPPSKWRRHFRSSPSFRQCARALHGAPPSSAAQWFAPRMRTARVRPTGTYHCEGARGGAGGWGGSRPGEWGGARILR